MSTYITSSTPDYSLEATDNALQSLPEISKYFLQPIDTLHHRFFYQCQNIDPNEAMNLMVDALEKEQIKPQELAEVVATQRPILHKQFVEILTRRAKLAVPPSFSLRTSLFLFVNENRYLLCCLVAHNCYNKLVSIL